ncbi:Uncharacterized protein GBIM_19898, partial [Gryllus bimaculatus]
SAGRLAPPQHLHPHAHPLAPSRRQPPQPQPQRSHTPQPQPQRPWPTRAVAPLALRRGHVQASAVPQLPRGTPARAPCCPRAGGAFGHVPPLNFFSGCLGRPFPPARPSTCCGRSCRASAPTALPDMLSPPGAAAAAAVAANGASSRTATRASSCGKVFPRSAQPDAPPSAPTPASSPYKCNATSATSTNKEKAVQVPLCDRCFGQQTNRTPPQMKARRRRRWQRGGPWRDSPGGPANENETRDALLRRDPLFSWEGFDVAGAAAAAARWRPTNHLTQLLPRSGAGAGRGRGRAGAQAARRRKRAGPRRGSRRRLAARGAALAPGLPARRPPQGAAVALARRLRGQGEGRGVHQGGAGHQQQLQRARAHRGCDLARAPAQRPAPPRHAQFLARPPAPARASPRQRPPPLAAP